MDFYLEDLTVEQLEDAFLHGSDCITVKSRASQAYYDILCETHGIYDEERDEHIAYNLCRVVLPNSMLSEDMPAFDLIDYIRYFDANLL